MTEVEVAGAAPASPTSMFPFGIYDSVRCGLVHIGLYESEDNCWRIFLGWPTRGEVRDAKDRGLVCLPITCLYDPPEIKTLIKSLCDGDPCMTEIEAGAAQAPPTNLIPYDIDVALRCAEILGPSSASALALCELKQRLDAGEDVALFTSGNSIVVGPRVTEDTPHDRD